MLVASVHKPILKKEENFPPLSMIYTLLKKVANLYSMRPFCCELPGTVHLTGDSFLTDCKSVQNLHSLQNSKLPYCTVLTHTLLSNLLIIGQTPYFQFKFFLKKTPHKISAIFCNQQLMLLLLKDVEEQCFTQNFGVLNSLLTHTTLFGFSQGTIFKRLEQTSMIESHSSTSGFGDHFQWMA